LEHNTTELTFKINTLALPVRLPTLYEHYDFDYVGDHIFSLKTTLTEPQAYPAIPDPNLPVAYEAIFKVTITTKC
jgi:hypothetical protein